MNRLRIIQLVEADFNVFQKVKIGRELMSFVEKNNLLPDEMYGGRKGKSVHDALIIQNLIFDITRQENRGMICLNLDAEKCYDRVFPSYSAITMASIGLPLSIGITLAKTQKYMSHRVRTEKGISKNRITPQTKELFSGVGQGWGAAGPAWLSVEAPMISVLKKHFKGISLQSPNKKIKILEFLVCLPT